MPQKFREYILVREVDEGGKGNQDGGGPEGKHAPGIQTTLVLGKNNPFKPFVISDDNRNPAFPSNRNLAPIVRAFQDSKKVRVYDSMGKGGEPKPHTLGAKTLYMVGGAVRDHLIGKTPHDIDLATDATPDEIRMILSDAGFTELQKDRTDQGVPNRKIFYVVGKDKTGADFVFGVKVNGQEFELATFRKDSHGSDGRHPDKMSLGGHADDAARRDLTMNSLYLLLSNPDGPNNQLTDFHGGVRDIESGDVRFVGKPEERLEEDLLRALRYARFAARFGKNDISPETERAIVNAAPKIRQAVSPERIQQEFVKGIENEDTDPTKLIQIYKRLGLLGVVFPGMSIKLDSPDDYPKDRDRAVVVASLLRGNHPGMIEKSLREGKWKNEDIARVAFLHRILNMHPHMTADDLDGHLNGYNRSGIMGKSVESWWDHNKKGNPELLRAFMDFAKGPRVRAMVLDDETGEPQVDPDFAHLFDPLTNKPMGNMGMEIGRLKKDKEHANFLGMLHNHHGR